MRSQQIPVSYPRPATLSGELYKPAGDGPFDVWAGATHLSTLPVVDGRRLGAIGWSHGGWTMLRASLADGVSHGVTLRGLVAFYPYCGDMGTYRSSIPLLILAGGQDDWTPAEPCRVLAETARRGAGATVEYDPRAHADAEKQLKQFLDTRFKP